jgi:fructokinase
LEAHYLAQGVANLTCAFAPQRIVMGGGIMRQGHLLELVASELRNVLSGYVPAPELVPPGLEERSGVLGALAMAQDAGTTGR